MSKDRHLLINPDRVRDTVAGLGRTGLSLASADQIVQGRAAAAALLGDYIASLDTLMRIHARCGASLFAASAPDGRLVAVLSLIPLTPAAAPGLAIGQFDGIEPPDELVARPSEPVIALYGWGMAGLTWRGRAMAMSGALAMQRGAFAAVPIYGRAASDGGGRVLLGRMGASLVPRTGSGLVRAPAWADRTVLGAAA